MHAYTFTGQLSRVMRSLSGAALAVVSLHAQSPLSGPIAGFVFDAGNQSIRAVVGLPPSAYLGAPVLTKTPLASVAPNGKYAIALVGTRPNLIADLTAAPVAPAELIGSMDSPDRIVWAADSASAVLFSSTASSLQFLRGGDAMLSPDPAIDLSTAGTGFVLLAADPAHGRAAIALNGPSTGAVYLVEDSGAITPLGSFTDAVAGGALTAGGTLYIAGQSSHQVWMLQNPKSGGSPQAVLGQADGVNQPAALAVDAGGSLLYLADKADRTIRVYDMASWTRIDELTLDSVPSTLEAFGASLFLVNARRDASDPVLLLKTGPGRTVMFIPAGE